MQSQRTLSSWIAAATVLPVVVFTFGHVYGQQQNQGATGSEAVFAGRPALAGAQAGTGAMAGPPQGGIGPQSTDQPGGGVTLRAPAAIRDAQPGAARDAEPAVPRRGDESVPRDPGVTPPSKGELAPRKDRDTGEVIKREREHTGWPDSTGRKVKKSAQRTYDRSRHGVIGVE